MAAISPITLIFNAVDQASPILKNLVGQVQNQLGVVTQLSFAYNQVTQTIQGLAAQGAKAYDLLIGQNVRLQEELLGTKASLVATNKILENGLEIKDPTKAINALTAPVNQAIKSLREGSLELVGVTSSQLIPIYQLVAQNAGAVGINLQQASGLTLDFAAALGTLGIPLFQANEEINSILNGTITTNSRLAKSLDINNAQVAAWKAQGVLVDRLTTKLSAFRAGNALAAQTINGVTSNIQEIAEEITRIAGEPLLAPIVAQLTNLYNFLKQNKDAIQDIAIEVVNFFIGIGEKLGEAIKILEPVFKTLAESVFTQLSAEAGAAASIINILADSFVLLVKTTSPLLEIIANILAEFSKFSSTDIGGLIIQAGLLLGILAQFAPLLLSVQTAFIIARTATLVFWAAVQGSPTALAALNVIAPTLATVTSAFVAAGGGVAGLTAAFITATGAAKAFAAETAKAIAPLLPLIALGGAVTLTLLVKNTGDLRVANEELEDFRIINDALSDQALDTAKSLNILNQAAKDNGTLTKEQEAQLKKYQSTAKNQIEGLKDQIKYVKELNPANEEQANNQKVQIKQLELMIGLLERQSGGVTTAALDLQKLGNDYQQLSEKVRNAQAQFDRPVSAEIFKNAAKEIVDFTSKQFEAGGVSAKLAIQNLERVRNDIRLEYEQRVAAQDAIIKIRQTETDRRVKITENEQQQIQVLISNQVLGDAEGQRQISANKIKQLNIQLEAVRKNIAEETKLRNSQISVQVADIDKKIVDAEKKKSEAEKAKDKQGTRLADEDIARLQAERTAAKSALSLNNEKLLQQKNQEIKFASELAQERGKEAQRVQKEALKDFDEQQSILDANNSQRLITQEQFNQQSLTISQKRANAEIKQLEAERKKLSDKDTEGLEVIAVRQAAVRKKLAEDIEKFEQSKSQIRLAKIDTEQKNLAAKLADGLVYEQQFNKQSFELTKQRLQAELDEVNRQRSKLKPGDSRLDPLNTQAAEIRKRQLDAVADNQDKQVQLIEKAQRKATEIVNQSEQNRLNEITRLEADKAITGAKAKELRVNNTRKTIETELALEKDKLNKLLALPAYSDPIKEESRQSQIRASRLKTSQLIKALIDNEVQQRETVFRVFEDIKNKEIQAIQNQANSQTQLLDNQIKLNDYVAKNLSIQKDIISSRKDLISTTASYLEGELKILGEMENNENSKKQLAESAAEIRLKAAQENLVFETKLAILRNQEKEDALEVEKIQLRIEKIKARSATLSAQAELDIVKKDPTLDPEAKQNKIDAATLRLQAAQLTEGLLGEQAKLLDSKGFANQREAEASLIKQRNSSQLSVDQERLNLANSRVDTSLGAREKEQLAKEIRARRFTADDGSGGLLQINENTGKNLRFIRRETDFDKAKFNSSDGSLRTPQDDAAREQTLRVTRQVIADALGLKISSPIQTARGQTVPQTQFVGNVPQTSFNAQNGQLVPSAAGNFTVNISNTFNPADVQSGKASATLTEQVRSELFSVFTLANRR
jgi:hypothetical protein